MSNISDLRDNIIEFTEIKQEEVEKPEPQVQEQQTTSKVANIVSMSTGNTREKADFSDLVQENQETPGVIIKRSPLDDLLGDNFKKYIDDKKKEMDADKIMGFESGADDYITKPFNILELKARIRAMLRRAGASTQKEVKRTLLTAGHISLDSEQRVAIRDGETVELTAKEFDLLELLMKNPRRVYSRENLMDLVWGYTYAGDFRTVDVHIRRLREKLEKNPAEPELIMTKWGVGYYLKS